MAPKRKPNKSPNTSPIKSVVKNSNAYSFSIENGNNDPYNGKRRKQTKIKKFFKKTIKKIQNQGSAIREPTPQDRRENYHKKFGNQMINYSTSKQKSLSPAEKKKIKELENKIKTLIALKEKKEANKRAKEEANRKAKENNKIINRMINSFIKNK
jgi:Asp-tRNA(Asn)/Glu-tRNA(Gln) amidotransferase A subunit family amidase|tara:strand:- start:546 stop:1010 length:465 start_codon:yes stop_codon:yes gene_type:complete